MVRRKSKSRKKFKTDVSFLVALGFVALVMIQLYWKMILVAVLVIGISYFLWRASKRCRNLVINASIDDLDRMTGIEFEQFLGRFFNAQGYKVTITPPSGDFGADLVLKKDRKSIAVQAKRYTGKVGVDALQQVLGGRDYYGCGKSKVITNSYFTKQAVQFAQRTNIELWDRARLGAEIYEMSRITQPGRTYLYMQWLQRARNKLR
ncbi:restriction endonuclease [Paenibacillus planticolens]|uniref:Restriction endonuclease n=1 Tax=Paenibacillus planticolens TaxID=2654976 RepID=A0ABX1ZKM0_9BACL|nr:restriction endonuclease [Paenibacillus planticolens]NOU99328.1 restriction endonuclease [Paenibacillus planticolens]